MIEKNSYKDPIQRILFLENHVLKNMDPKIPSFNKNYTEKIYGDHIFLIEKNRQKEKIHVVRKATLKLIKYLKMQKKMGNFFKNFKNPVGETKNMLETLVRENNIVSVAYNEKNEIIGYLIVLTPQEERFNLEKIYQIGSIEVSKDYRGMGIATELMKLFEDEFFDDKIIYTFCYSWHWDTTECTVERYRKKILHLLHAQGFVEEFINDINIKMDPYNIFAVRYGKNADPVLIKKFKEKLI